MNKQITINERIKKNGLLLLAFLAVAALLGLSGVGCLFKGITGIPCPFCGMTRAMISVLQFDFKTAFYFHPLFPIFPLFIILLANYINFKDLEKITFMTVSIYFVVYLVRILTIGIP